MMSRITIHLKRAGDRLRDNTTLSSPNTLLFNRDRRRPSTQFWDHPFDTSMPEPLRLSADQTPLPPSPTSTDDMADRVSLSTAGHHDFILHKPPPLVLASSKIPHVQIV